MCQRLEGHQLLKNQRGGGHLQPDRRAVIDGPGKGPKEDLGELRGKKGYAQADANPDIPGRALGLLEDLVNENRLQNSAVERGEGRWAEAGQEASESAGTPPTFRRANFLANFGGCRRAWQGSAL